MQSGVKAQANGELAAPNLYTITVHPAKARQIQENGALLEDLAQTIQESAGEAGVVFLSPPVVRVVSDDEMPLQQYRVSAQISIENLAETSDLIVEASPNSPIIPVNAFIIVNGTDIFPLSHTLVNIGRRPDNELVIQDARVSRVHAQLRAIKGRYVIFDLDSSGGTFVNDQRVHQSVLYPGDVISLGGVPLVFGQEETQLGQTQKLINL
jgi:hypothetical protein